MKIVNVTCKKRMWIKYCLVLSFVAWLTHSMAAIAKTNRWWFFHRTNAWTFFETLFPSFTSFVSSFVHVKFLLSHGVNLSVREITSYLERRKTRPSPIALPVRNFNLSFIRLQLPWQPKFVCRIRVIATCTKE